MKNKEDFNSKLAGLANKMKTEPIRTPIQEVRPVEQPKEDLKSKGSQLNVWIPNDLMKAAKLYGLDNEMTLKEITIKALEEYLKR